MEGMAFQLTKLKLPTFLCVGAQKAGTTTLHSLLGLHPMIFLPPRKEIHYFSLHYNMGLKWYSDFFSSAKEDQLRGEITPYYLFHPFVAERIAQDLGRVRIIILLRDPVARTLSHYSHACRLGFEDLSLEEALQVESSRLSGADDVLKCITGSHRQHQENSYLSRSLYEDQVKSFWHHFDKTNVLVLPSEFMFSSPWECLKEIFAFLEIPPCDRPDEKTLQVCKNQAQTLRPDVDLSFAKRLRQELDDSYQFVRQDLGWDGSIPWQWYL